LFLDNWVDAKGIMDFFSNAHVQQQAGKMFGALVLALVASGCSTSSDPRDWPIATYTNVPDNGSSLTSLTGELRMVDDCVVVVAEEDGRVYLPVFRTPGHAVARREGASGRRDPGTRRDSAF